MSDSFYFLLIMGVNLSVRKRLKGIKWYFRGGQPYC